MKEMDTLRVGLLLAALFLVAPCLAADQAPPTAAKSSCFLSREYMAGVRDRALIKLDGKHASVLFEMTYCNYVMSPDCANARSEELEVKGTLSANLLRAKSSDGSCAVAVRFVAGGAWVFVSQESACPSIKYWGPHGIYVPEKLGSGEQSACTN